MARARGEKGPIREDSKRKVSRSGGPSVPERKKAE